MKEFKFDKMMVNFQKLHRFQNSKKGQIFSKNEKNDLKNKNRE